MARAKRATAEVISIGGEVPTDGGAATIAFSEPFTVRFSLEGSADMLFHRWNPELVEEKARAAKGSAGKKTDNVESYVYKDERGFVCLPGEYVRQSMIVAAKFRQDPRSPRKSAQDLFKAAIVSLTPLASLGVKTWDYEDRRRVVIQRNGVNRTRPAMHAGWKVEMDFMISLPEYINPALFNEVLQMAGRLIGVADFRPTYGRFQVTSFKLL